MPADWLGTELRAKWERFQDRLGLLALRKWVNEYPTVTQAIAAASGMLLLAVIIWLLLPAKAPPQIVTIEKEWYYDLNTGDLFIAPKGLEPPIPAPSGPLPDGKPAGVRAYVLGFGYEPNEYERFIGFLETTPTPEILARWPVRRENLSAAKKWGKGKLIRRTDDKIWFPADSAMGQRIMEEAFAPNEDGERPTYCRPK
jgi:hypothetical protein